MEIHGSLDLRGNELKRVRIGSENGFPTDPQPGRILFMPQDRMLYICAALDDGLPVWVPCAQVKDMYRHTQAEAALEWSVQHDLNISPIMIQVYDENGKWVVPDEIAMTSDTLATVKFNTPTRGTAIALRGELVGQQPRGVVYTQNFTESATWVVLHNLGYNPDIKVYVGGYMVQPSSIVHDSVNQATITFTEPKSGVVTCA